MDYKKRCAWKDENKLYFNINGLFYLFLIYTTKMLCKDPALFKTSTCMLIFNGAYEAQSMLQPHTASSLIFLCVEKSEISLPILWENILCISNNLISFIKVKDTLGLKSLLFSHLHPDLLMVPFP
jgi:hypothetical protein